MNWLTSLLRRLLSKEQRRFIKFCVVGASGVPVNLLCTWFGYHFLFFNLPEINRKAGAYLLGIIISIFTNFLLNDIWTWKDRDKVQRGFLGRMLRFYLVCAAASLIQFGTAMGLSVGLHLHYLLAQLIGIALATVINFLVNNLWTFRARSKTPDEPPSSGSAGDSLP